MICTKRRLNEEIERIKKILLDNGYLKNIINAQITKKIAQLSTLKRFGPEKCPVCLTVPWIGKPSTNLEKEVETAVESCYGPVSTRLVFTSKRMLPVARKDVLPAIQKSVVIYEYKCYCDSRYVGRTSQRLQDRIKQHVPQWLRQQLTRPRRSQPHRSCKRTDTKPDCDSAIGQHLLDNHRCALNYDDKRGFQSSPLCAALSILIFWRLLISRPNARCYADRKSLFTLSNSFDNRGIWPPAASSLTFAIAKSFFGALCNTSAIIGLS